MAEDMTSDFISSFIRLTFHTPAPNQRITSAAIIEIVHA